MRQIIIYLFVSLATFIIGVTTATPWTAFRAASDGQATREILRVEREYLDAHVERDQATLARILTDDFSFSHFWGRVTDKAERLALLENTNLEFRSIDTREVEVRVDGDRATVTGVATVRGIYRGEDFVTAPYRFTRTYERLDGRWLITSVRCSRYGPR